MNKLIYILFLLLISLLSFLLSGILAYSYSQNAIKKASVQPTEKEEVITNLDEKVISDELAPEVEITEDNSDNDITYNTSNLINFYVYNNNQEIGNYATFDEALNIAKTNDNYFIVHNNKNIWSKNNKYQVYKNNEVKYIFKNYTDALQYASNNENTEIYNNVTYTRIFNSNYETPSSFTTMNLPLISNTPEFYKGSEIASLSMLLSSININIEKEKIYAELEKDFTPFSNIDNNITFGNPNKGLTGDIFNEDKVGYGTFNKPLYNLLNLYTENAIDLTGVPFTEIERFVSLNIPVLVITNDTFKFLDYSEFINWYTEDGIEISKPKNYISVVVIGYDDNYVYINNPIKNINSEAIPKDEFISAWEQMGSMAVSYIK